MKTRAPLALVSFGCAAAVALALVGAAFAVDVPTAIPADSISRGDRLAAPVQHQALTVQDVNSDGAVSNLVRINTEPVTL